MRLLALLVDFAARRCCVLVGPLALPLSPAVVATLVLL